MPAGGPRRAKHRQRPGPGSVCRRLKLGLALILLSTLNHQLSTCSASGLVSFAFTNNDGTTAYTNFSKLVMVGDVNAGGSANPQGIPIRVTPAADGRFTNRLATGNWYVTNSALNGAINFRVPADEGPTVHFFLDPGVWISGGNFFVTLSTGTNGAPTFNQVSNALGYVPPTLAGVTNTAMDATNGMGKSTGLAAFQPTNAFDLAGVGASAAQAATNRAVFTNDTTWFDPKGAALAGTNGMGKSTGLAAFQPTNTFDMAGAGAAAALQATQALGSAAFKPVSSFQPANTTSSNLAATGAFTNGVAVAGNLVLITNGSTVIWSNTATGGASSVAAGTRASVGTNGSIYTVSADSQTNGVTFTNDTTWFDPKGAALAGTNGMGKSTGLAAFQPTNSFDMAGAGTVAVQAATNRVVFTNDTTWFDLKGVALTASNGLYILNNANLVAESNVLAAAVANEANLRTVAVNGVGTAFAASDITTSNGVITSATSVSAAALIATNNQTLTALANGTNAAIGATIATNTQTLAALTATNTAIATREANLSNSVLNATVAKTNGTAFSLSLGDNLIQNTNYLWTSNTVMVIGVKGTGFGADGTMTNITANTWTNPGKPFAIQTNGTAASFLSNGVAWESSSANGGSPVSIVWGATGPGPSAPGMITRMGIVKDDIGTLVSGSSANPNLDLRLSGMVTNNSTNVVLNSPNILGTGNFGPVPYATNFGFVSYPGQFFSIASNLWSRQNGQPINQRMLRVGFVGDSLVANKLIYYQQWFNDNYNYCGGLASMAPTAGATLKGADYGMWINGVTATIPAGESITNSGSGFNPVLADTIEVIYFTTNGAGQLNVLLASDAAPTTYSAIYTNIATAVSGFGVGVTKVTFPLGDVRIKLTATNGTCWILPPLIYNSTLHNGAVFIDNSIPGGSWNTMSNTPTTTISNYYTAMQIDMTMVEETSDAPTWSNAPIILNSMLAGWTNLIVITTPAAWAIPDTANQAQIAVMKSVAAANPMMKLDDQNSRYPNSSITDSTNQGFTDMATLPHRLPKGMSYQVADTMNGLGLGVLLPQPRKFMNNAITYAGTASDDPPTIFNTTVNGNSGLMLRSPYNGQTTLYFVNLAKIANAVISVDSVSEQMSIKGHNGAAGIVIDINNGGFYTPGVIIRSQFGGYFDALYPTNGTITMSNTWNFTTITTKLAPGDFITVNSNGVLLTSLWRSNTVANGGVYYVSNGIPSRPAP